ncbi:hypothetical protein CWS43_20830 [Rahnella sp. AA]|uniref:hypothetical protein n=1 Tax=Rahnella sp. AA TaxID=2057180 RepID=UPI000C33E777|nr:hypothetical protein [Rahnella sp. AA]PKE28480.1 hypothetical protein CWS43_20830 [Rahnella sp. AA]
MKHTLLLSSVIITAMTLSGCSSYNSLELSQQQVHSSSTSADYTYYKIEPPLYDGDVVQYSLRDGSRGTLTIKRTTPQTLMGDDGHVINLSELVSLKRKEISKGKTAAAVGTGAAATVVVVAAVVGLAFGAGMIAMLSAS